MDIGSVDIAAMSIAMKQAQVSQQVDIAVMKESMDFTEDIANMLVQQLMQVGAAGGSGHIDISV